MLLQEPETKPFRISQEDIAVVDDQLVATDLSGKISWSEDLSSFKIKDLNHELDDESWEYTIELAQFRIS